jgi:hypothetical protein
MERETLPITAATTQTSTVSPPDATIYTALLPCVFSLPHKKYTRTLS